jgi:hypothetical protein
MLAALESGADVVVGPARCRAAGSRLGPLRRFVSRGGSLYARAEILA